MKLQWANRENFYYLIFLFLLIFLYLRLFRWKKNSRLAFADPFQHPQIFTPISLFWTKTSLKLAAIAFLILALADPISDKGRGKKSIQRLQLIFAVDISKSMAAEDIWPSRLEHAKSLITSLAKSLPLSDKAIIVYGDHPQLLSPFTSDPLILKNLLEELDFNILPDQGTDMAACIRQAVQLADNHTQTSKAMILFSDGENHEKGLDKAMALAQKKALPIYTVGIGTEQGARVPDGKVQEGVKVFKKFNGQWVISRLNKKLLTELSLNTNGKYIEGNAIDPAVFALQEALKKQRHSPQWREWHSYAHHFQFFIGTTLILLILEIFLKDIFIIRRKSRFSKKIFRKA